MSPRNSFLPAGFTLLELILVIVIAGILSVAAYSRINVGAFTAEGSTDALKAAVRYAQKVAVAQRQNVYVSVAGTQLELCYASDCSKKVLKPPSGSDPFKVDASGTIAASDNPFYFDSLGRPTLSTNALATNAITLSVANGTRAITVEPQTGFVH